jgi:hypothetical protein
MVTAMIAQILYDLNRTMMAKSLTMNDIYNRVKNSSLIDNGVEPFNQNVILG